MRKYIMRLYPGSSSSSYPSDVRFGARLVRIVVVVVGGGQRRLVGELFVQGRRRRMGRLVGGSRTPLAGHQQREGLLQADNARGLVLRSGAGRCRCRSGRDLVPVNTVLGGDVAGLAQRRILRRGGEGHATAQRDCVTVMHIEVGQALAQVIQRLHG